jgi:5'(3')-deoxyribonucleotidase
MRIGLDLDGVVYDFNKAYIRILNRLTGSELLNAETFQPQSWHYDSSFYSDEVCEAAWKMPNVHDLFSEVKPLFGAKDFVRKLRSMGHDIVVLTTRPKEVRGLTMNMFQLDFSFWPSFFFSASIADKMSVKCDVYIDDHPDSKAFVVAGKRLILMDAPYNRNLEVPIRCYTYEEILNKLLEIEEEEHK